MKIRDKIIKIIKQHDKDNLALAVNCHYEEGLGVTGDPNPERDIYLDNQEIMELMKEPDFVTYDNSKLPDKVIGRIGQIYGARVFRKELI